MNCSTSVGKTVARAKICSPQLLLFFEEKTEKTLADGSVEIMYSNGNLKTISADGKIIRMKYFNGDTKETNLNSQTIK